VERIITQRELRNDNAQIMRALEKGDSFIITRNGVAVGRLTAAGRRTFVPTSELRESAAHLPRIEFRQFREDIDACIDQDPSPHG
jgi:antitoxin (DNA-binding transcriptional repressor) of toxin-antitoxin stability system